MWGQQPALSGRAAACDTRGGAHERSMWVPSPAGGEGKSKEGQGVGETIEGRRKGAGDRGSAKGWAR